MKSLMGILALLSLFAFSVACNRDAQREEQGMQREEDIRGDDIRENDTFDRSLPVEQDEMEPERDDMDMGPNESSVTE